MEAPHPDGLHIIRDYRRILVLAQVDYQATLVHFIVFDIRTRCIDFILLLLDKQRFPKGN